MVGTSSFPMRVPPESRASIPGPREDAHRLPWRLRERGMSVPCLLFMAQPKTVGYGTSRKSHADPAGSEHHRHDEDGGEAHAWQYDTGPMARLVAVWKRAVRRAEDTLVASAGAFAAVDVVAA